MDTGKRLRLIRLAADGELKPEDVDAFEKHLAECPEDAAAVEGERELRAAVHRVMSAEVRVPDDLRDRVERAWAEYEHRARRRRAEVAGRITPAAEAQTESASASASDPYAAPARTERRRARRHRVRPGEASAPSASGSPRRRRRVFVAPSGLAAGILVLITVSILASIFTNDPRVAAPLRLSDAERAAVRETFDKTRRGFDETQLNEPWLHTNFDDANALLAERFGLNRIQAADLREEGFVFYGIREGAQFPGSLALVYVEPEEPTRLLVVWIQGLADADPNLRRVIEPGKAYRLTGEAAGGATAPSCYAWVCDGVMCYFRIDHVDREAAGDRAVTDDASRMRRIAQALGMPKGEVITFP